MNRTVFSQPTSSESGKIIVSQRPLFNQRFNIPVFFSHRTFNQRLAAMLATYGLTAWNKSLNQEELKTWYEARWMPVFRFGGNYREDETTHLIGEQQEIYEAVSGETSKFLQYVEDDEQMRLRKRYLDDLYRLKENYPVLTLSLIHISEPTRP